MSENGCGCSSTSAAPSSAAASPCGSGAQYTEAIWDPLALAGSTTVVSSPVPTRGANAFDFIALVINAAGAIQTLIQAQVSNDGVNWSNAGASVQIIAVGYTASGSITGNGFLWVRFVAVNQVANLTNFDLDSRFYCG